MSHATVLSLAQNTVTNDSPTRPVTFITLPLEIRESIYRYLFSDTKALFYQKHERSWPRGLLPWVCRFRNWKHAYILQVCRQVRNEALAVFHAQLGGELDLNKATDFRPLERLSDEPFAIPRSAYFAPRSFKCAPFDFRSIKNLDLYVPELLNLAFVRRGLISTFHNLENITIQPEESQVTLEAPEGPLCERCQEALSELDVVYGGCCPCPISLEWLLTYEQLAVYGESSEPSRSLVLEAAVRTLYGWFPHAKHHVKHRVWLKFHGCREQAMLTTYYDLQTKSVLLELRRFGSSIEELVIPLVHCCTTYWPLGEP